MKDIGVLDMGCGSGNFLLRCRNEWGQKSAPLAGIDLMESRIENLKRKAPFLDVHTGSADELPWDDNLFDLAHQSMLFSSVLDEKLRRDIAREMQRIIKPGGRVLWYDFIWNPMNKSSVGIPFSLVRSYFPDWVIEQHRRITLPPPIARPLLRISESLVTVLEACRIFNCFELILLRKPAGPSAKP